MRVFDLSGFDRVRLPVGTPEENQALVRQRAPAPELPPLDFSEPFAGGQVMRRLALLPEVWGGDRLQVGAPDGRRVKQLLASGQPVSPRELPERVQTELERVLPPQRRGVLTAPHAGLRFAVFDMARLASAGPDTVAALDRYLARSFVRAPIEEKKATLHQLRRLLLPGAGAVLEAFHLPRKFTADPAEARLTHAFEAEGRMARRPEILHVYAPDPTGALRPELLTDTLLTQLRFPGRLGEIWNRLDVATKRERLRWSHLSLENRQRYLEVYRDEVDPKVTLHRITDPRVVGGGLTPLPDTIADVLLWEGTPLRCAEVNTKGHYETQDVLFDDIRAVAEIAESQPGYHIHHVAKMSEPASVKRNGPRMVGLAGLEDLRLFTRAMRVQQSLLHHTHLEVWSAEALAETADSLRTGVIDPGAIDIHKFHCAGLREGIYGGEGHLGIELRAVPLGAGLELATVSQRITDILADPEKLQRVPSPPWDGFDAGAPGLANQAYEVGRKMGFFDGAQLDFESLFELAAGELSKRDAWKFACPLWKFEAIPGLDEETVEKLPRARERFIFDMMSLSETISEAIEGGREVDQRGATLAVKKAIGAFFRFTDVDVALGDLLDDVALGRTP